MSPVIFSWHAGASGKTAASRSSARMRWICGGTFLPPWKAQQGQRAPASQRQRVVKTAKPARPARALACTEFGMQESEKRRRAESCAVRPARCSMPLSVAAACNSKLNERQKRLRSASPQALLMRPRRARESPVACRRFRRKNAPQSSSFAWEPRPTSRGRPGRTRRLARRRRGPSPHSLFSQSMPPTASPAVLLRDRPARDARVRRLIFSRRSPHLRESSACAPALRRARRAHSAARPGVLDQHAAGLHAADSPGIFPSSMMSPARLSTAKSSSTVPTTALGLAHNGVKRIFRDRAAAGDGRKPASAPPAQRSIYPVAMQIRAVTAAPRGNALREHGHDLVEIRARQIAVRIGAANQREEIVFVPVFRRARGHNLLRQNVERSFRNDQPIEFAAPHRAHQRRAFEQFVARRREDAALRNRAAPVAGAADALQRHGDRAWRTDLADQIDVPISMPSSSEAVATSARSSPALNFRSAARRSLRDRLP